MSNCPNCGVASDGAANYCVRCGSRMGSGCPSCGVVNRAESLYCHACGSALAAAALSPPSVSIACPRCSSANAPGTTFCYSCGLPLEEFGGLARPTVVAAGVPAGFWIRLLAWLIDTVVLAGVHLILLTIMPGTSIELYYADESFWTTADSIMIILSAIYYTVGVSVFSTTVGKRVLGLYVLRRDGTKVNGLRAFARHVASGISELLLFVGYLMIGFSQDKRGLHDHICDTVVVKK